MAEQVKHPTYYNTNSLIAAGQNPVEVWNFVKAHNIDFDLGNVIKYVVRAGKKDGSEIEDLKKAQQYLEHHIAWVMHQKQL